MTICCESSILCVMSDSRKFTTFYHSPLFSILPLRVPIPNTPYSMTQCTLFCSVESVFGYEYNRGYWHTFLFIDTLFAEYIRVI